VNEAASKAVNAAVNKAVYKAANEPGNDAFAVLYGLTLGLTAPDEAGVDKVAYLVESILNRSRLTTEDLDALKAAAVVIVRYGKHN
jgi:hypothetical protein